MTFCPQPKPRPAALERADRRKARESKDAAESRKVKARSGGRCEMVVWGMRCPGRAVHVHHLLNGFGIRGRNASALAVNKLHLCTDCHRAIHAHILVQDGERWRRIQ